MKVADQGTLNDSEINQAIRLMKKHQESLIAAFNKVKAGKKIKTIKLV